MFDECTIMLGNMKITLTLQQKLEQMHDTERYNRVCDRLKAVLLVSEDWSQFMIAQPLHLIEYLIEKTYSYTHQFVDYVKLKRHLDLSKPFQV